MASVTRGRSSAGSLRPRLPRRASLLFPAAVRGFADVRIEFIQTFVSRYRQEVRYEETCSCHFLYLSRIRMCGAEFHRDGVDRLPAGPALPGCVSRLSV